MKRRDFLEKTFGALILAIFPMLDRGKVVKHTPVVAKTRKLKAKWYGADIVEGFRGSDFLDAGYVYAPYQPTIFKEYSRWFDKNVHEYTKPFHIWNWMATERFNTSL